MQGRTEKLWDILRCLRCGFGWTSPRLAEREVAAHYAPDYLGETARAIEEFRSGRLARTRSWRKETEKVRLLEGYVPHGRILDVGCGDGRFLWALDGERWERTGVDLARATVDLVRSRITGLALISGDIFCDRLEAGSFDAVTFWHALEHVPHPERVLVRAGDLLRPGGRILISLPAFDSLQARIFRRYWYAFDDVPRHLHHFSRAALDLLLANSGLKVESHLFFSRVVNFHCLKHSLLNWSQDRFTSRLPYYLLKPLLFGFLLVEQFSGKYGMATTIARKPG
jgi:2-polyprenyl-3-methyl-5-hydroxy-6-metoxy-1,4-benzoquinol methylase